MSAASRGLVEVVTESRDDGLYVVTKFSAAARKKGFHDVEGGPYATQEDADRAVEDAMRVLLAKLPGAKAVQP